VIAAQLHDPPHTFPAQVECTVQCEPFKILKHAENQLHEGTEHRYTCTGNIIETIRLDLLIFIFNYRYNFYFVWNGLRTDIY